MANVIPNSLKQKLFQNSIDFENDTIRVALLDNNHSNDVDNQEFFADVNANEVSGTGYSAGGQALSNVSTSQDNTDDEGVFDADNVTWGNSTISAYYAVIYKDTGNASTSPIIGIIDFGGEKSSDNGDFTIDWDTEGIVNAN